MKKFLLYLEFLLVCAVFVIPPFFAKPVSEIQNSNFSLTFLRLVFLAISLLIYYRHEFTKNQIKSVKKIDILMQAGSGILCYGILMVTGTIMSVITIALKIKPPYSINLSDMNAPLWISVITCFLISAFCEETVYRLYLPSTLALFTAKINACFLAEFISVAVFAFSHIYLGVPAVINAFLSGITLRFFAVKNKTILTGTISHFFYNITIFILMYYLKA